LQRNHQGGQAVPGSCRSGRPLHRSLGQGRHARARPPRRQVSRRKGVAEELPERERRSLREFLRDGLDHETIKAAIERALAGGNESARVAA
jgi:hypothetical protein